MATPVQNAPKLEIGKLTAEEAERFASMFRPAWELDDAPFAAGTKLSANDMDALAGGAGIAPEVQATKLVAAPAPVVAAPAPAPAPAPVPVAAPAKVEVELDVEPDATPAAAPAVAEAKPEPPPAPARAKAPYTPPRAPPAPVRMAGDSGEYAPVKKSNTGLILAVVGVLAVGGAIFGIRAAMSGSKTEAPVVTTSTATHEEARIPPPPPETAATADTKPAATREAPTPPVAQTSKPVAETSKPAETVNPFAEAHAAPPAHTTPPAAAPHPPPPHHATAGGGAGAGSKPHGSGIVRDNPF